MGFACSLKYGRHIEADAGALSTLFRKLHSSHSVKFRRCRHYMRLCNGKAHLRIAERLGRRQMYEWRK